MKTKKRNFIFFQPPHSQKTSVGPYYFHHHFQLYLNNSKALLSEENIGVVLCNQNMIFCDAMEMCLMVPLQMC